MVAAIAVTAGVPASAAPPALNSIAPDFALKAVDGRNMRLSEYRGEPVVLHFWASWCGPCRESVAALDALGTSSGTAVLGVNLDGVDRSTAVADSLHLKTPTLVDAQQSVARAYDVMKLPLTLLLDAEGHVRASWSGVPADLSALTPQLERLRQD
ncbi:MAG: TlpA disulfide reductase family protein [Steroidobacteraceae bacterium]